MAINGIRRSLPAPDTVAADCLDWAYEDLYELHDLPWWDRIDGDCSFMSADVAEERRQQKLPPF
jgi:hypothetical protein